LDKYLSDEWTATELGFQDLLRRFDEDDHIIPVPPEIAQMTSTTMASPPIEMATAPEDVPVAMDHQPEEIPEEEKPRKTTKVVIGRKDNLSY
ncbi:MAG: hypothetical protein AAF990_21865, partial [Bacteroidota bacterium]